MARLLERGPLIAMPRPAPRYKQPPAPLLWLFRAGLVAGFYVLGAQFGLDMAFENKNVTTVWPPTGIALAALLLWGIRMWPGIAIGAFVANLLNGAGFDAAFGIAIGNTAAPLIGATMLGRLDDFDDGLERFRDVFTLFFVAAVSMTVSASSGTAVLWLTDTLGSNGVERVWLQWWIGDAVGVVLFAPFLLVALRRSRLAPLRERPIEAAALCLGTLLATLFVFNVRITLAYLAFGPVVWAALRLGQIGATGATVLLSMVAVTQTAAGLGPFLFLSPTENLLSLQILNAAVSFTGLSLAAIRSERAKAEGALRASEERYRKLFEQASDLVCIHDLQGRFTHLNAAAERITGFSLERLGAMRITDLVAPEYVSVLRTMTERQLSGQADAARFEIEMIATNGRRLTLEVSSTLVFQDDAPVGVQLIARDITYRALAEDQLRQQALHDPLTGLPNRTLLNERAAYAISLAQVEGHRVGLALVDVDHFKEVNDSLGTERGDVLLKKIGAKLQASFKDPHTVARLGGDEFAVLVPMPNGAQPDDIGRHVLAVLSSTIKVEDANVPTSASVGVAFFPDHSTDSRSLTTCADVALSAAKRDGGGRFAVYHPDLDRDNVRRLTLISDVSSALANGIVLHYQPKIDIETLRTTGVEGLIRWVHPRHGTLSASEFLPLVEECRLTHELTKRVVEMSLKQCSIWHDAGMDLTVSVHISGSPLRDASLVGLIRTTLRDLHIPPERLILEVSEDDIMEEASLVILERLSGTGVRVSVDNFGAGYSSMVRLRRVPMSEIKIDRALVAGIASNSDDFKIVRSIIDLGHNLGVEVVAQGIETRETWNRLAELGCDQAQGYLICPPVPAAELESWMLTPSWSARVR